MKEYEVVREIENLCGNNQMRDVFFEEVQTDDPAAYVRSLLKDRQVELTVDIPGPGRVNVYANASGMTQKFLFTEIRFGHCAIKNMLIFCVFDRTLTLYLYEKYVKIMAYHKGQVRLFVMHIKGDL